MSADPALFPGSRGQAVGGVHGSVTQANAIKEIKEEKTALPTKQKTAMSPTEREQVNQLIEAIQIEVSSTAHKEYLKPGNSFAEDQVTIKRILLEIAETNPMLRCKLIAVLSQPQFKIHLDFNHLDPTFIGQYSPQERRINLAGPITLKRQNILKNLLVHELHHSFIAAENRLTNQQKIKEDFHNCTPFDETRFETFFATIKTGMQRITDLQQVLQKNSKQWTKQEKAFVASYKTYAKGYQPLVFLDPPMPTAFLKMGRIIELNLSYHL